jgi:hypothetical protein
MDVLLAVLLILLGLALWVLAGLLPVLGLQRDDGGRSTIVPQLTWMGAVVLWQQQIRDVTGARVGLDPENTSRERVELVTPKGRVPLTGPFGRGLAPARLAHIIDRFAEDEKIPTARLPLFGRMRVMLGFGILFPLGTASLFVAVLLLLR